MNEAVAIRLLGFHGVALACSGAFAAGVPTFARVAALVVGLGPFCVWCFGKAPLRRRDWLAYGLVPSSVILGAAIAESWSEQPTSALDGFRIAAGLLAQLFATNLLDRPLERSVEVEVRERSAAAVAVPTARAFRRAVLLGVMTLAFAVIVLAAPFVRQDAASAERTFAAVAGSVLAATACLTVLPGAMRRDRKPAPTPRARIGLLVVLAVSAALVMALEYWTRVE